MATSFLKGVLRADLIRVPLKAENKPDVIKELLDIIDSAGALSDRMEAERVVMEREQTMSTGLECGIAIPHGKTDTVNHLQVGIGIKPQGIDFDCADGQPANIFIITLSPASGAGPHIRFMAEISRLLRNESVRGRILQATSPEAVLAELTGGEN